MDSLDYDHPEVSVIIPASDDSLFIRRLIQSARKITPSTEVIVVCPGLTPHTPRKAHAAGVKIIHTGVPFTYDEGRAIGATHASGEILLFLDERVVASPELLKKYVTTAKNGWDVVITSYSATSPSRKRQAQRTAARLLNHILAKAELGAGSMCTVPYAIKRGAIEQIGHNTLCNPPLALAYAVKLNLSITSILPVPVLRWNVGTVPSMKKRTRVILQDHAEAIRFLMHEKGTRGGLPDGDRYRILLQAPGLLHLRSVFYQEPNEREGDGWGAKRKTKRSNHKKTGERPFNRQRKK
ncbi:glycosyltransferase family 2 protein [Brevibacillus sp. NRS-1366]|uniref:glycosyltransferase family 2 protein n=1 Tax=Brevibacillus sp. NRS-1366 TaxID=3233899 RepID=UPI003D20093A